MAWNFAGSLGSSLIGAFASNASSRKQYKYQSRLQAQAAKLNYDYGIKSLQNSPTAEREGLESAGYNPMLAVQNATSGANSGWTTTGQAQNVDYGQALSNAFDFKRLQNETKTAESTANLQNEQAMTEENKRRNFDFDSMMKDAQKHMTDKQTSWIDKEKNAQIYKDMQEAERARAEASVVAYNADTARIIANAKETESQTNKYGNPYKALFNLTKDLPDVVKRINLTKDLPDVVKRIKSGDGRSYWYKMQFDSYRR